MTNGDIGFLFTVVSVIVDEKRDEMIKETTKLTLVKGGGVNEHTT